MDGGGSSAAWERWCRRPWMPVLVGVLQIATTVAAAQRVTERRPVDALAIALLAVGPALLWLWHRAPVLVLAGNFAATAAYYTLGYRFGPAALSLAVAMVVAVATGRRRAAWVVTAAGLPTYLLVSAAVGRQAAPGPVAVVAIAAVLGLVLAVGEAVRVAGERRADAERARVAEQRRRVSDERLRVARDLHDVLAHHVSLVNMQANVALRLFDRDPEQARASVAAIKEVSRETLDDLRAALAVLRRDTDAPRRPSAGLSQVDELLTRSGEAGLRVTKTVEGEPRQLATAVDLAAFRIVQEAVTNVRRHSAAGAATLRIAFTDDAVTVTVQDHGPAATLPNPDGDGITGMRERAVGLAGTFESGPTPSGGFRVYAELPYRTPS
ncbi:sensor histidine kinase [Dactylosporangium sp. NPDC049742]|uniref:sensor histidine kinase n=1 Tax=Dactylosporangium sp. NPDC049742 TaxID=3154737 RepID=UPI0034124F4C